MRCKVINRTGKGVAEVLIYEDIGPGFFGDGLTAKSFATDLADLTDVDLLRVRINSGGGDIFDGLAIFNAIQRHAAKVETIVDGLAGSIASVIAQAGDTRRIAANAQIMIHEPYGGAPWLTASEHRGIADVLDRTRETILDAYVAHAGEDKRAALSAAIAAETWYKAGEAVDAGLADEIDDSFAIAAKVTPEQMARYNWKHVPEELLGRRCAPTASIADASKRLGAARERLRTLTKG